MSKVLATAAEIIGVAALAVTGVGAIVGGAAFFAATGVAASTLATDLALTAAVAGIGASSLQKKPAQIANPMEWQADPNAGVPHVMGRCYTGGWIIYRQTFGKDNVNETINTVYSNGPIKAFEKLYVDAVATSVDGSGQAGIGDYGKMYVATQRGLQPEPAQLGGTNNPDITTASKLSGLAASTITLSYDTKGGHTLTTEPQAGFVVQGTPVYDPRADSTYPGGEGPQRWNDETTWSYDGYDNPYLKALSFLIGYRQNGKLVIGVGCSIDGIIVSQLVEGANVADANGWKMGGTLTSKDDKWQRLKDILQAGGGEPLRLGAQIGCLINTPRVSLGTITIGDVVGDASVQATQARRDRINSIVPSYMAELDRTDEQSDGSLQTTVTWTMVPGSPVTVGDYVTFDGKTRQKPVNYTYVQNLTQSQQLARYDIENAREFGPITLRLKLRWMGYKPGDVLTAELPELGLNAQDILLLQRELSPQDMMVTMTARSETAAKHAFALGQTGTAPETPTVSVRSTIPAPASGSWALAGTTLTSASGSIPAIIFTGAVDSDVIDSIIFEYRLHVAGQADGDGWIGNSLDATSITRKEITSTTPGTQYDGAVSYRWRGGTGARLILGPVTAGSLATAAELAALIQNSYGVGCSISATSSSITVSDFTRRYSDEDVEVAGSTVSGLAASTDYLLYYDDLARAGGAVTIHATTVAADAYLSAANPGRHYVGEVTTSATGGGTTVGGGSRPPGGGGPIP